MSKLNRSTLHYNIVTVIKKGRLKTRDHHTDGGKRETIKYCYCYFLKVSNDLYVSVGMSAPALALFAALRRTALWFCASSGRSKQEIRKAETPLLRFAVDMLYNKLYNKSITVQQIKVMRFALNRREERKS